MKLYADIGNSRIKLVQNTGVISDVLAVDYEPETLPRIFAEYCNGLPVPDRIVVSNVAGGKVAAIFTDLCLKNWSKHPEYLCVKQKCCGVTQGYTDLSRLGVDRWLAMIAAWNKYKTDVCVIDCGSTVTVDIVSAGGQHLGGYIIPGMHMMRSSLVKNTGQISLVREQEFSGSPGMSTEECVVNGTGLAVVAFIRHVVNAVNKTADNPYICVITGGSAGQVMKLSDLSCHYEPSLVMEGIRLVEEC